MAHGNGACPTTVMASYVFEMSFKSIFNLILAAGDMLAGAQSQIVATGHAEYIKLVTIP